MLRILLSAHSNVLILFSLLFVKILHYTKSKVKNLKLMGKNPCILANGVRLFHGHSTYLLSWIQSLFFQWCFAQCHNLVQCWIHAGFQQNGREEVQSWSIYHPVLRFGGSIQWTQRHCERNQWKTMWQHSLDWTQKFHPNRLERKKKKIKSRFPIFLPGLLTYTHSVL